MENSFYSIVCAWFVANQDNILIGLTSGIVSGLIANYLFRRLAYSSKPELVVSDKLIKTFRNEDPVLKVKLINHTKHDIVDVHIILYHVNFLDHEKKRKSIITLSETTIPFINEFSKKDKSSDFAYQASLRGINHQNIHDLIEDKDEFLLFIKCTNSYHGSVKVINKFYKKDDILGFEYDFESGDTTNSLRSHDGSPRCTIVRKDDSAKASIMNSCPFIATMK